MNSEDINSLLKSLEGLMYGRNYQVVFRLDYFEYCTTFGDFKRQFKQIYSGANMEETSLSLVSSEEFWNDINEGLDYRGDDGAGLHLSDTREKELKEIQKRYKDCIALFMNKKTKLFRYNNNDEGMPGYPVFWGYQFVLQTDYFKYLFVYGSASD